MFVRATTYSSKTGTRELDFPFQCEHCGVSAMARVWSEGSATSVAVYGLGGNAESARRAAEDQAVKNAQAALAAAPCPRCGGYASSVIVRERELRARVEKRLQRRLPFACFAGLGTLALFGGTALLAHSPWFLAASVGAAIAAAGLVFAIMSRSKTLPAKGAPPNVRFWSPSPEGASFFPQNAATPPLPEALGSARGVARGIAALASGGTFFLVALVMAATNSTIVYVVNTEAAGPMTVRLDGRVTAVPHERAGSDAGFAELVVPHGQHTIEALDAGGAVVSRADFVSERWGAAHVFAPAGKARGACVVAETGALVNETADFFALPQAVSRDAMFRRPAAPRISKASAQRQDAQRALRVYACSSLEGESEPTAFAPHERAPSLPPVAKPAVPTRPASAPRR